MSYACWIVRPDGVFHPTDWQDNPATATALLALPEMELHTGTHAEINVIAQGFNEQEIETRRGRPVRMWALVVPANNHLTSGQAITVRNHP